ncbi:MAG: class I SAM-dependent methyltransferase [Dehalococcoidia bacterium]
MRKLDFGCGSGGYPGGDAVHPRDRGSWLEKYGDPDTIAIDIDLRAIREARRRTGRDVSFLLADGKKLPFVDNSLDYVREWGVLHHVVNYLEAIEEIARVLKEGGEFVACETVDNDPIYSFCRTVVGNWKGTPIESRFKSEELLKEIEKYFKFEQVEFWHRPLVVDIPSYFLDRYPGMFIGLYWQYYASRMLYKVRLLPHFARHVAIRAIRK